MKLLRQARDLCYDTTFGGARAAKTRKLRMAAGKRKAQFISGLSRSSARASKLVRPSVGATLKCGISVAGTTSVQLKRIRSTMLAAAGIRHFAKCGCTSYRLQWAWLSDPLVSEPAGLIKQYLRALVNNPKLRAMLGKAWHGDMIQRFIASSTRAQWMRVCGPTTALIATLRDLGWAMIAPGQIATESGEMFQMNDLHQQEILHHVAKAAELREQTHAAAQHLGSGMQEGIDISPAKKFIQQLRSSNQHKKAGTATAAVAAGCWFKNRVGTDVPGRLCRVCQREEDSEGHLFWQCQTSHLARAGCDKDILEESDHLRGMANEQVTNQACLWCRGILPMARLDIPDQPFANHEPVMEGMDVFSGEVCTDGT